MSKLKESSNTKEQEGTQKANTNGMALSQSPMNAEEMKEYKELFGEDGKGLPGTELITRIKIPNTPFEIIRDNQKEGKNCWIAQGMFKVVNNVTEEEAKDMIERRDWELISNLIACISETVYNILEQEKNITHIEND